MVQRGLATQGPDREISKSGHLKIGSSVYQDIATMDDALPIFNCPVTKLPIYQISQIR